MSLLVAFRGRHVQFSLTLFYLQDTPDSCSSWKKTVTRKATKPYTGNNTSGVAAGGEKKKKYSSQQQHCFSFSVLTHSPPNTFIFCSYFYPGVVL